MNIIIQMGARVLIYTICMAADIGGALNKAVCHAGKRVSVSNAGREGVAADTRRWLEPGAVGPGRVHSAV